MGDILKEAIADAKAVRETALENAKMALEEAFTPQLKSMLSAKLKEDDMEDEFGDEEEPEETYEDEEAGEEEVPAEEVPDEGYHEDDEFGDEEGEEVPAEDYHFGDEEGEEEEGKLDLEAIIRELEAELSEGEDEDDEEPVSEGEDDKDEPVEKSTEEPVEEEYEITLEGEDEEDDKEEVDEELDKSSDIGKGDNNRGSTDVSSGIGKGSSTEVYSESIVKELNEYKEAVKFLKDKLHEVNILNAKLLFTNKLFKSYSLDNNQKLKVVETFDRAQTTREIKLVYSTLAEQFQDNGSIVTRKSIKESASAPVASTKPSKESRKVISEEAQVANRFKKLAGIIK